MNPVLVHVHVPKCAGSSFRKYRNLSTTLRHLPA